MTVVAAPPARVSQHTCEHHLGIPKRSYLESLPAYQASGGEVIRYGRLRLVEPDSYLAWLATRTASTTDDAEERIAAELGLRSVGGGR